MIVALALAAALQMPDGHVFEVPEPGAGKVTLQAIIQLPMMDPRHQALAAIMAETMTEDVEDYSKPMMQEMAANAGEVVQTTVLPDHIRIQLAVTPGQMKTGINMLSNILRKSRFKLDVLAHAIDDTALRRRNLWSTALQPVVPEPGRFHREDVLDLYARLCRPENVWVSFGGEFASGVAQQLWEERTADWKVKKPYGEIPYGPGKMETSIHGGESVVELYSPIIPGVDVALPAKLLAIIALGSGKGSVLFGQIRGEQGWSYRQEALLWPVPMGFEPRLIFATADPAGPEKISKQVREVLAGGVAKLSEADLKRAQGMAEAILLRGVEASPLYFDKTSPISGSLADRTFMSAYWHMKTGQDWAPERLLFTMRQVTLSDLKEEAGKMIEQGQVRYLKGSG